MRLESLTVAHLAKLAASKLAQSAVPTLQSELKDGFYMESCQRRIWVLDQERSAEAIDRTLDDGVCQVFHGQDAYRFLLQVATGLKSEVAGETDVFGQFKEAWKKFEQGGSELACELSPWVQRVFEDTKEIRARYLQGLGGATYGSLVRRLLRELDGQGPVLVAGAGQIAQSVAPWLLEYDLLLWNRSEGNLQKLESEIAAKATSVAKPAEIRKLAGAEAEERAWREARHVVACIPLDAERDAERIRWWKQGEAEGFGKGRIIHLGGLMQECGLWSAELGERFRSLDDLFRLMKEQDGVRSIQLAHARKACEERAILRSLGNSITIPHGWEYLAAFAGT